MKKNYIILFLILIMFAWACGSDGNNNRRNESDLPAASSLANEILVVMDSTKWKGQLGDKLRDVFSSRIPGLPQEEPTFNLRYVSPRHFQGFHRLYPNIIFVTVLNDQSRDSRVLRSYFTKNSLEQMRQNPEMFMFPLHNEFARGQEVLHLFAPTEEDLIRKLDKNDNRLVAYFLEFERNRLSRKLFTNLPNKGLSNYLEKRFGVRMEFPIGYEVAIEKDQFIWIRRLDQDIDQNIWLAYKDYDNENVFTQENILELRSSFAKPYIWGSDSTTYMKTEMEAPIHTREVNFKGRYAMETRGLWRLNKVTMGGPFISYTFVDEATNRLYYIEGFTYAPGEDKREPVRELEAILHTFRTAQDAGENSTTALETSSSE